MKHLVGINEDQKHKNYYRDLPFTKEQLDKMDYREIYYDLRTDLIQKSRPDYDRKCNELDIYLKIRFKQKEFDMYAEWLRKSQITDKVSKEDGFYQDFYVDKSKGENYFTETDMGTYKLLCQVVDKLGGPEKYYQMLLKQDIDKLGESQYGLY